MKRAAVLIAVAVAVAAGYYAWLRFGPAPAPVGVHVPAKVASQVKGKAKMDLKVPKVVVYEETAKKALKLPEATIADKNLQVVESTPVDPDMHAHTITTLIDAETGTTKTFDRREPLPWIALRRSGALGLRYDLLNSLRTLYVRQDLLQSKQFVLSGYAAIRSDYDKTVAVQVEYRW